MRFLISAMSVVFTAVFPSVLPIVAQEPPRTEIATAGFPARAPTTAPDTIVECSAFYCPFCGRLFPTLKAVENIYLDRVRIVYRQFPLRRIHPLAEKAAEAS